MKARIAHIILFGLLLLGICSCGEGSDEPLAAPVPVLLDLDIALTTRAGDENTIPAWEEVDKLRIILIDEEGKVECNRLFTDIKPTLSAGHPYRYEFNVQLETTTGKKSLYAVANAEDIELKGNAGNIVHLRGVTSKDQMDGLVMPHEIGVVDGSSTGNKKYIPIASKRYDLNLQPEDDNPKKVYEEEIVMVYDAVKFDFTYKNQLGNLDPTKKKDIRIVHWSIDKVANQSYLIPHIGDWDKLIQLGGSFYEEDKDENEWIYGYEVPSGVQYKSYTFQYDSPIILSSDKPEIPDSKRYYLHESKNPGVSAGLARDEQEYYLTLGIKETDAENAPTIILGPEKFPNLKSLVRGTHVTVTAIIKSLPESGKNDLEVRVQTWERKPDVEGGWEPVSLENGQ